jgi:hypothetical protein
MIYLNIIESGVKHHIFFLCPKGDLLIQVLLYIAKPVHVSIRLPRNIKKSFMKYKT